MKAHKVNIILFITLIIGLGTMNLLVDHASGVMTIENRISQPRPSFTLDKLLSGELFRKYDQYVADHFVFREGFIGLAAHMENMKRVPGDEQVQIVSHQGANTAQRIPSVEPESTDPPVTTDDRTMVNVNAQGFGHILIYGDRAMEIHKHNETAVSAYAQTLNHFSEQLPKQQVYTMQIPTAIHFLDHEQYRKLSDDQPSTIAALEQQLHQNIISIDTVTNLERHSGEDLYFRTDHHWTARAAYYAYAAFMEQTGRSPLPIEAFDRAEINGFLGSLYGATRNDALAKSPDTMEIFLPPEPAEYMIHLQNMSNQVIPGQLIDLSASSGDQPYSVFLGGDHPLAVITNHHTECSDAILVVKDSYANAFIPFLVAHYREVHVIDPRLYNGNLVEYAESCHIDEVLFTNYVLVHRYDGFVELLEQLK